MDTKVYLNNQSRPMQQGWAGPVTWSCQVPELQEQNSMVLAQKRQVNKQNGTESRRKPSQLLPHNYDNFLKQQTLEKNNLFNKWCQETGPPFLSPEQKWKCKVWNCKTAREKPTELLKM